MSNHNYVYQQVRNVSVSKDGLKDVASNIGLSENDLRVFLVLLTQLDGWKEPVNSRNVTDPLNYKKIDKESIATLLDIKKKEIKKCINNLMEAGLIDMGDSNTISDGYRFTF